MNLKHRQLVKIREKMVKIANKNNIDHSKIEKNVKPDFKL